MKASFIYHDLTNLAGAKTCLGTKPNGTRCLKHSQFLKPNGYCESHQPTQVAEAQPAVDLNIMETEEAITDLSDSPLARSNRIETMVSKLLEQTAVLPEMREDINLIKTQLPAFCARLEQL